jgi:hypothetical protein
MDTNAGAATSLPKKPPPPQAGGEMGVRRGMTGEGASKKSRSGSSKIESTARMATAAPPAMEPLEEEDDLLCRLSHSCVRAWRAELRCKHCVDAGRRRSGGDRGQGANAGHFIGVACALRPLLFDVLRHARCSSILGGNAARRFSVLSQPGQQVGTP